MFSLSNSTEKNAILLFTQMFYVLVFSSWLLITSFKFLIQSWVVLNSEDNINIASDYVNICIQFMVSYQRHGTSCRCYFTRRNYNEIFITELELNLNPCNCFWQCFCEVVSRTWDLYICADKETASLVNEMLQFFITFVTVSSIVYISIRYM